MKNNKITATHTLFMAEMSAWEPTLTRRAIKKVKKATIRAAISLFLLI
jgi:hypothetical protein